MPRIVTVFVESESRKIGALRVPESLIGAMWASRCVVIEAPVSVRVWDDQVKAYEDKMWATLKKADAEAETCNTNRQPCTMGKLASTTIVPVKPAEIHKIVVSGLRSDYKNHRGGAVVGKKQALDGKKI